MKIVSSHRPHKNSEEFARNQTAANMSWRPIAERIYYLGNYEGDLAAPNVTFVESEQHPTIRRMAKLCSEVGLSRLEWVALVNADIVLSPRIVDAIDELNARNGSCGMSLRYQFFVGHNPQDTGSQTDLGIDFFIATKAIWAMVSKEVPEMFRIGHILFDTWLMSFFARWGGSACYDLTPQRLVFHPIHGDRNRVHPVSDPGDYYTTHIAWPKGRLRLGLTCTPRSTIPAT